MVEVFKTDVRRRKHANYLVNLLVKHFPDSKINFDLKDCDRILRVEGKEVKVDDIMVLVKQRGFDCKVLEW